MSVSLQFLIVVGLLAFVTGDYAVEAEESLASGISRCADTNSEDCFGSLSSQSASGVDGLPKTAKSGGEATLEPKKPETSNEDVDTTSSQVDELAKEVTDAFSDIGELLNDQLRSLAELQKSVQKQALRVQQLQQIAANGFPAYQANLAQTSQGFPQGGGFRGGPAGGGSPQMFQMPPQAGSSSPSGPSLTFGSTGGDGSKGLVTPGGASVGLDKTVAKFRAGWFDYMALQSAVKVDAEVSSLLLLPQDGGDGLARYLAIGDVEGKVYLFRPQGELIIEFHTGVQSPVTSMSAYVIRRNETMLLTGHGDGSITMHKVGEQKYLDSHLPEDLYVLTVVHKATAKLERQSSGGGPGEGIEAESALMEVDAELGPVLFLESYRAAQMRFIVAVNHKGEFTVLKENGTLHGTARTGSSVIKMKSGGQMSIFMTEHGAGALDLLTMTTHHDTCKGLNDTRLMSASFDSALGSRVYALTSEGEILNLFLGGERKTECTVRARRAAGVTPPGALAPIKGYVLAATSQEVWAFNTTGSSRSGPRFVLQDDVDKLGQAFGHTPSAVCHEYPPLLAYNKQRQVVVSLCNGYVGIFESHLPIYTPPPWNPKLWSQPLFIGAIVLVAMWQFYSQKRKSPGGYGGYGGGRGGGMDDPAEILKQFKAANSQSKAGGGAGYDIPDDLMRRVQAESARNRGGRGI